MDKQPSICHENGFISEMRNAIFKKSISLTNLPQIHGYDFNLGIDWDAIMKSMMFMGFQATNMGIAINEINKMIAHRKSINHSQISKSEIFNNANTKSTVDNSMENGEEKENAFGLYYDPNADYISYSFADNYIHCGCQKIPQVSSPRQCAIFLSFTSNLVSCGVRDIIRYLVQHHMVDVLITTAGGVEEDLIKCLAPTYLGDFDLPGSVLRSRGLNRIGNLLVPNDNYCAFEDWIKPILDDMLVEQRNYGTNWTPSKMISRFGHVINDPRSIYYWCHRNNIPVFCPALTDGSIGDMLYFHSYKNPGLKLDIIEDVRRINDLAVRAAPATGVLILGGGLIKHHTLNANMMRNGADYSVYINTHQEFDGSDAGADPGEAMSWGKIKSSPLSLNNNTPEIESPSQELLLSNNNITNIGQGEGDINLPIRVNKSIGTANDNTIVDCNNKKDNICNGTNISSLTSTTNNVPVKLFAEASLVFPFIVGATFAKHHTQERCTKECGLF